MQILVVLGACVWMIALISLSILALEDNRARSFLCGVAAICLFALPFGVASALERDPHEARLCLNGHEEWRTTTWMPTAESKRWICEEWER